MYLFIATYNKSWFYLIACSFFCFLPFVPTVFFRSCRRSSPNSRRRRAAWGRSGWQPSTRWWTSWSTTATRRRPPSPSGRTGWTKPGPTCWSWWRLGRRCWPPRTSCTSSSSTAERWRQHSAKHCSVFVFCFFADKHCMLHTLWVSNS